MSNFFRIFHVHVPMSSYLIPCLFPYFMAYNTQLPLSSPQQTLTQSFVRLPSPSFCQQNQLKKEIIHYWVVIAEFKLMSHFYQWPTFRHSQTFVFRGTSQGFLIFYFISLFFILYFSRLQTLRMITLFVLSQLKTLQSR